MELSIAGQCRQSGRLSGFGLARRQRAASFEVEGASPARASRARTLQSDDDGEGTQQQLNMLARQPPPLGHRSYRSEESRQCPSLWRYRAQSPTESAWSEPGFLADDWRRTHTWIIALSRPPRPRLTETPNGRREAWAGTLSDGLK